MISDLFDTTSKPRLPINAADLSLDWQPTGKPLVELGLALEQFVVAALGLAIEHQSRTIPLSNHDDFSLEGLFDLVHIDDIREKNTPFSNIFETTALVWRRNKEGGFDFSALLAC